VGGKELAAYFCLTTAPTAQVYVLESMAVCFLSLPSHGVLCIISHYCDTELVKVSHSLAAFEKKLSQSKTSSHNFKYLLSQYPGASSFGSRIGIPL